MRLAAVEAVDRVVELLAGRPARGPVLVLGITGGVGAGKSTLAAAVGARLDGAVIVGTDGFLYPNAVLDARGLAERKGFPESFDGEALGAFLDAVAAGRAASAPTYSHLAYDVVPGVTVDVGGAGTVVVEGLHLGHPGLGVRDRFDLLVHLDADDADQERWYLERFRTLRTAAAADPTAFLHPYTLTMSPDELDAMATSVWHAVNLRVLHDEVRPWAAEADITLHLGPDHRLV